MSFATVVQCDGPECQASGASVPVGAVPTAPTAWYTVVSADDGEHHFCSRDHLATWATGHPVGGPSQPPPDEEETRVHEETWSDRDTVVLMPAELGLVTAQATIEVANGHHASSDKPVIMGDKPGPAAPAAESQRERIQRYVQEMERDEQRTPTAAEVAAALGILLSSTTTTLGKLRRQGRLGAPLSSTRWEMSTVEGVTDLVEMTPASSASEPEEEAQEEGEPEEAQEKAQEESQTGTIGGRIQRYVTNFEQTHQRTPTLKQIAEAADTTPESASAFLALLRRAGKLGARLEDPADLPVADRRVVEFARQFVRQHNATPSITAVAKGVGVSAYYAKTALSRLATAGLLPQPRARDWEAVGATVVATGS